MTIYHHRKKQPELVRTSLIKCAKALATENGLPAISVQAICDMAGVTKGAFFRHFPNKDALLNCVFEQMVSDFSDEIENLIAKDPCDSGAFTRAYLEMGIDTLNNEKLLTLWKSAMSDEKICCKWREWYLGMLIKRGKLEESPDLAIVRLAADGLCLSVSMQIVPNDLDTAISRLRRISSAPVKAHSGT
ncbi:TetR/AcrR family transcriptional regulator [Pectobacterium actinidiae]|uniref:TetR/AcrR family transcriptional regulator n=1 Tax=Pectobacterium actinidiae TaxID=1507808 RepID=UPI0024A01C47|nr:TetR/AcrR family transcriptional regulator [Pectobacterium actinidiae]MDY4316503.1 TetR/AcrR family transcriptional regulator [Pectobacterium actinidiae]GLW36126.1 TetR family transcriptional regulator [Pectobacterium carotovorum subsp. carotovorum]